MKSIRCEDDMFYKMLTAEQIQRLHQVIREELTEAQREVLLAYYFQDLTMEQIAVQRGTHRSTVCRLLHRAEDRIKRYLRYY